MATTPTNNSVPSESPIDLKFNAGKIDEFVTSMGWTYTDRFGVKHYTIEGINYLSQQVMNSFGYITLSGVTFTTGATISNPNEVLFNTSDNTYYKWTGSFATGSKVVPANSTPQSSGGVGPGKWLSVGDSVLRTALLNNVIDGNNKAYGTLYRTLKYFGAVGDGIADDTSALLAADAYSISSGEPIRVTNGTYKVKNASIGGHYLFDADAWIQNSALGQTDNLLIAKSGLKLIGANIKVGCAAWGTSGNYGNAILIGGYYQPSDESGLVSDVLITRFTIVGITTAFQGQAIELLGNVERVEISDGLLIGPGTPILAHWGGDVDLNNAHDSIVTYSHHPNNLKFSRLNFLPTPGTTSRPLGLYLSAAYNVKVEQITGYYCPALLSVTPGDVYDQVAVSRDKGQSLTGIEINGIHTVYPIDGPSGAIILSGIPATYRTSATRLTARDNASPMQINVKNIVIDLGSKAYTNPMLLVRACKNVDIQFASSLGGAAASPWAQFDYNDACLIRPAGSCPSGVLYRGDTGCEITADQVCYESVTYSINTVGAKFQTFTQSGLTSGLVNAGSTSCTITSSSDAWIFVGAMLYSGSTYIGKVTRSTYLVAGVATSIPITKSANAIASGSAITSNLPCDGTKLGGVISGFMYDVQSTNTWGLEFTGAFRRGFRGGILCDGLYCKDSKFTATFDGIGWEDGAAVNANIHITATQLRNVTISGCRFDSDETNTTIDNHVLITSTDHAGVIISNNTGTVPSAVAFSISNSTVAEAYSMQQIYGNHINGLQAPVATATGLYFGGYFRGVVRNNAVPTTGFWNAGDKVDRPTITTGGQEGWVCINAGSPGTWVGYGVVASS